MKSLSEKAEDFLQDKYRKNILILIEKNWLRYQKRNSSTKRIN